jgi:hypothetical protein
LAKPVKKLLVAMASFLAIFRPLFAIAFKVCAANVCGWDVRICYHFACKPYSLMPLHLPVFEKENSGRGTRQWQKSK